MSCSVHTFKQWPQLAEEIAHAVHANSAVLDGEICCLEPDGRTASISCHSAASGPTSDVLSIEGEGLTALPLLGRKRQLLRIMPAIECRLLYLDHIERRGCDLFRVAYERDLEGIVAKWARGAYRTDGRATSWLKIKNREYTADARSA